MDVTGPNAPAFPIKGEQLGIGGEVIGFYVVANGVSKRELFAAMAMQGLCARPAHHMPGEVVPLAITIADALLSALSALAAPQEE